MPDLEKYISGEITGDDKPRDDIELQAELVGEALDEATRIYAADNPNNECWSNCDPACSCGSNGYIAGLIRKARDMGLLP